MIRLQYPEILYLLAFVPVFFLGQFFYLRRKKKQLQKFAQGSLIDSLVPDISYGKQWTKFIILNLAFVFIIIAAANPQIGTTIDKSERKGSDIMICLDISNSMYAQDIKPDRITRAKQALGRLIDQLNNDRIGIVVFAGSAYTQLPITNDYGAAKTFLDVISPSMIQNQGTAIAQALQLAYQGFGDNVRKKSRAIILISDGEDNDEDAVGTAHRIAKEGVTINTLGFGLAEGAMIPMPNKMGKIEYKKKTDGSFVMTKINEPLLKEIAKEGKGVYVRANNSSVGLEDIMSSINSLDKNSYSALA